MIGTQRTKHSNCTAVALALTLLSACGPGVADCTSGCPTGEACSATTATCRTAALNGEPPVCATSQDTWAGYGSGFFNANCSSCHGGAFSSPGAVAQNAAQLQSSIGAGRMPRGRTLTGADRTRILNWLACE